MIRTTRKHPHGRGEDVRHSAHLCNTPETPPRAWGRHIQAVAASSEKGNTPTGVGKTSYPQCVAVLGRKHPHGRGEDVNAAWERAQEAETPPRAWGRLHGHHAEQLISGNTPTGVGKTRPGYISRSFFWKHPHGRGEDKPTCHLLCITIETPPRAWGRQAQTAFNAYVRRNTPTGVGKTPIRIMLMSYRWKHPHGRGEDGVSLKRQVDMAETPPRAWGRRLIRLQHTTGSRNTPTGVGKTRPQD